VGVRDAESEGPKALTTAKYLERMARETEWHASKVGESTWRWRRRVTCSPSKLPHLGDAEGVPRWCLVKGYCLYMGPKNTKMGAHKHL